MKKSILQTLGPGLLFAGAAIGVSHLVQSTKAGAEFGAGLIWALVLAHLCKYPFFKFGPKYSAATGETLLEGYHKLGKGVLLAFFIMSFATMFTIQAAVTIVTASLAVEVFGLTSDVTMWSLIILTISIFILIIGRYKLLDNLMKYIILTLTLSTIAAVVVAFTKASDGLNVTQIIPSGTIEITFLIAFLGWMPAPLDISIWHSIWTLEKKKTLKKKPSFKESLFDFNVGYLATTFLALCFVGLGALVMYGTGLEFSNKGGVFAGQLIQLYTSSLGDAAYGLIAVAAFSTMLSTTITTLDASPRAMSKTMQLLFEKKQSFYLPWLLILGSGTSCIFLFLLSEMGQLVQIATVLSFITAPLYAYLNYRLVVSKQMPLALQPGKSLRILSKLGLFVLTAFTLFYLFSL